jgi:hypothetical protein
MCTAYSEIAIEEFMASNQEGLRDEDGDSSDWIEIRNRGDQTVDLAGYCLSDSPAMFDKWTFPNIPLEPGKRILVFASGKNRTDEFRPLHTNFKLSSKPGSLFLSKPGTAVPVPIQSIQYALQFTDISYGYTKLKGYTYFRTPTPGLPNDISEVYELLGPVTSSHSPGFYETPILLELTCEVPSAAIVYTLDGSTPDPETGLTYTEPIEISSNATIRYSGFKTDWLSPPVKTHTFLFPQDVLAQTRPASYPESWAEDIPADYELDTEIIEDPDYVPWLTSAMTSLPILHLTIDSEDLFDAETGIYMNTLNDGRAWERPATVELFGKSVEAPQQVEAGIRIQGRSSRKPETTPKHSFRLLFKTEYGPKRWHYPLFGPDAAQSFNTLVLRSTSNHSWLYPQADQRTRAQYLRDPWAKATQRAMGIPAPRTRFIHLYINHLYWGLYCISERPDDHYMADYFGGSPAEYDIRKGGEDQSGSPKAWKNLMALTQTDLTLPENYERVSTIVNMDSFIDYMILNHYIGNETWDYGNWYAGRNRNNGAFHFFAWDTETSMARIHENRVFAFQKDRSTALFQALRKNEQFRNEFSNRLTLHCTGEGALTPHEAAARYERLAAQIELPIIMESARWGDYRMNVHSHRIPPYERYTRNDHWAAEKNRLVNHYFPQRTRILLDQYEAIGLYVPPPVSN